MNITKDCRLSIFSGRVYLTNSQSLTVFVSLTIASPIILASNILAIISLVKCTHLKPEPKLLFLALSVSDCIIGIATIPLETTLFSLFRTRSVCNLEYTVHFLLYWTTHFSGYMISITAVQRSVFINSNMKRQNFLSRCFMRKTGLKIVIIVIFVVTAAEALISILFYSKAVPMLTLVSIDGIIFVTVYISYFWIYYKVWRISKSSTARRKPNQRKASDDTNSAQDHLAKIIAFILIATAVCYLPYIIIATANRKDLKDRNLSPNTPFRIYMALILVLFNSAVNAFFIMSKWMKKHHNSREDSQTVQMTNFQSRGSLVDSVTCNRFSI